MEEKEQIGTIIKFFAKPCVAAITLTSGEISVGDTIQIKGETTDLTQIIESIEIDRVKIDSAKAGQSIGIQVKERVRPNDKVYKLKNGNGI